MRVVLLPAYQRIIMTDLTKLPDEWRDEAKNNDPHKADVYQYTLGYNDALLGIANDMIIALPVWVRITDDESTWPEIDVFVLMCPESSSDFAYLPVIGAFDAGDAKIIDSWTGTWWRPLIAIDYPPEQS
jgi:hypothetical protein